MGISVTCIHVHTHTVDMSVCRWFVLHYINNMRHMSIYNVTCANTLLMTLHSVLSCKTIGTHIPLEYANECTISKCMYSTCTCTPIIRYKLSYLLSWYFCLRQFVVVLNHVGTGGEVVSRLPWIMPGVVAGPVHLVVRCSLQHLVANYLLHLWGKDILCYTHSVRLTLFHTDVKLGGWVWAVSSDESAIFKSKGG